MIRTAVRVLEWTRWAVLLVIFTISGVSADTVKLKSGEVIEGKITIETADYLTIAVAVTPSITYFDPSEIDAVGLAEMKKAAATALAALAASEDPRKAQAVAQVRESERDFAKAEFAGSLASAQNAARLWPEYEGMGRPLTRVQDQLQQNEASSRRQAEHLRRQRDAGTGPGGTPISALP